MILRIIAIMFALCSNFAPTLSAGCDRGQRLINEAGGVAGIPGVAGPAGAPGIAGAAGSQGIQGVSGIPGVPGLLDFSDFYALMPIDNPLPVAPGFPVEFPENGPTSGTITRLSPSSFLLPTVGSYLVEFQVSVDSAPPPSQLMLSLNGVPIANSVVGRDTGTSQIVGISTVTTSTANSVLRVINPPNNLHAIIIPPWAGSVNHSTPVSAHLVIIRIR